MPEDGSNFLPTEPAPIAVAWRAAWPADSATWCTWAATDSAAGRLNGIKAVKLHVLQDRDL